MTSDRSVRVKVNIADFEGLIRQYQNKLSALRAKLAVELGMVSQVMDSSTTDSMWPEIRKEIAQYEQLLEEVMRSKHQAITG